MVREYQVRWEGCSSKFDSWESQEKIQTADPAAVYRFNLEMAVCFGTKKPGASAQQSIVPSENPSGPRRSARLKSSSNSVSNTAAALPSCSDFAASSTNCSNSDIATASCSNIASSSNLPSSFTSKEEVKIFLISVSFLG
jgi:hypothetical protein